MTQYACRLSIAPTNSHPDYLYVTAQLQRTVQPIPVAVIIEPCPCCPRGAGAETPGALFKSCRLLNNPAEWERL